jgi:hypothetical protein
MLESMEALVESDVDLLRLDYLLLLVEVPVLPQSIKPLMKVPARLVLKFKLRA